MHQASTKKIPKWCEVSFETLGHHVSGSSLELQATQRPGSGGLGLLSGKDARGARGVGEGCGKGRQGM